MRMPACRRPLVLSAAGALALGMPSLAQAQDNYEYAQPAPDDGVVFRSDPVIQGEAVPPPPPAPYEEFPAPDATDLPPPVPPMPPVPPVPPVPDYAQPIAPPPGYAPPPPVAYGGQQAYAAPYQGYGYGTPMPAQFDRDAWLEDCNDRIRGLDRKDRAGVIGGLLGAVAGGVIGNRVWDSKRLAGTLIGAGVGGLAGVAVGSAIGASERRRDDECALYLDRYMAGGYGGPAYPGYGYGYPGSAYGYGYGYGYGGYALVPVLIAVPQRQVIRETVTEEWVDEPARGRSVPRHHHAAPRPDKRIKLIKGR
jgi:hypothetical protein